MPVNATFGSIVHAGKYRWQVPTVNATGQPLVFLVGEGGGVVGGFCLGNLSRRGGGEACCPSRYCLWEFCPRILVS